MAAAERPKRFLRIAAIVFSTLLTLLALAFLYSKFGGMWASSLVIPIPPSSEFIGDYIFSNGGYKNRASLYKTDLTLQETRQWYISNSIPMSPIDGTLSSNDKSYYSLPFVGSGRIEYNLLFTAAFLSANPNVANYEHSPSCFNVRIYGSLDAIDYPNFHNYFPNLKPTIFDSSVLVLIQDCWPDW